MLVVASLSLSLMGCSTSGSARILPRDIPGPPSYMAAVAVRDPFLGEDPYIIAARERAGRVQANRIIVSSKAEWLRQQADLAAEVN